MIRLKMLCMALLCGMLFMGAEAVVIDSPADGSGSIWDADPVAGRTFGMNGGSPLTQTTLYKKISGSWTAIASASEAESTDANGGFSYIPHAQSVFTASGDYMVIVAVMDLYTMVQASDANTWHI